MRYFFDIVDQTREVRDVEGTVLGTFEAVRLTAKRTLAEIAATEPYPADTLTLSMHVRDDKDREVYTISLSIKGKRPSHTMD